MQVRAFYYKIYVFGQSKRSNSTLLLLQLSQIKCYIRFIGIKTVKICDHNFHCYLLDRISRKSIKYESKTSIELLDDLPLAT